MKMLKKLLSVILVALFASPVYADVPNAADNSERYFRDLHCQKCKQEHMSGNWKETRVDIEDKGVTIESTIVADTLGNVSGGKRQGARYNNSMSYDINFDLEKFAKMMGTQFHISGLWRAGESVSAACIGNVFVASSIYGTQQFRFFGLYLDKMFLDKKLNIRIGRLAAGDDFASDSIYWNFVTNAIDGNPIAIPLNLYFPCYPISTWGVRAKYNFTDEFYTKSALYNGDPGVQQLGNYGFDFSFRFKRGLIFCQELGYTPTFKGLPGRYKAGFYYNGGTFRDQYTDINGMPAVVTGADFKKHIGNYGLYFHASQTIYKPAKTDCDEGLTPFAVVTLAPDNINQFPFFIDGGFIYKGLVPTRHHDITCVGFAYGRYADSIYRSERMNREANGNLNTPLQTYELIFDFSHKIEITPWMFMQPDFQYIVNPSGTNNIDDAFVVGTRFGLTF
ncbi:MAG: carbohydrate porin [Candidatus Omnitrophota bacterium]